MMFLFTSSRIYFLYNIYWSQKQKHWEGIFVLDMRKIDQIRNTFVVFIIRKLLKILECPQNICFKTIIALKVDMKNTLFI